MKGVLNRLDRASKRLFKLSEQCRTHMPEVVRKEAATLRRDLRTYSNDAESLRCALLEAGYTNNATKALEEICLKYSEAMKRLDIILAG